MSHNEIWDDSALVDSWNEALEEYKVRHCCHVRVQIMTFCSIIIPSMLAGKQLKTPLPVTRKKVTRQYYIPLLSILRD